MAELTEEQIIDLNDILRACDEFLLTDKEIRWLNYSNTLITTDCDYYLVCQRIIVKRDKNRTRESESLNSIVEIASFNGCIIEKEQEQKKEVVIPFFAGGV